MDTRSFIAQRIKEFRTQKLDITAIDLAERLDPPVSNKTISSWETGRTQPSADYLAQLSRIFNEPIAAFYPPNTELEITFISDSAYTDVPLYGASSAGSPISIIAYDATHPIPVEVSQRYPEGFLLKVEGESMNNILQNGSYALIDPEQTDPEDYKAYALCINGSDTMIKRIRKLANGYELIPDSKDPTFKSIIYDYDQDDPSEITIIGRVVWMMLPFDWEF